MLRAIAWVIWGLVCAAIAVGWGVSYHRSRMANFGRGDWWAGVGVTRGDILVFRLELERVRGDVQYERHDFHYELKPAKPYPAQAELTSLGRNERRVDWQFHSFALVAGTHTESDWQNNPGPVSVWKVHEWWLILPVWFVFGLATLPGVAIAWRRWRRKQGGRQHREGLCPVCGYDLRATPQRCPECGHTDS